MNDEILIVLGYTGILRDFFLILDGIHLFISIELAVLFFSRGIKKEKGLRVNFGWGMVYSCFALVAFMNIVLFHYLTYELWYENIKIHSLIGVIPGITIVGILESFYQKYHKSRYFFTLFSASIAIITFFTIETITSLLANISLLLLAIFMISFFSTLIKQSSGVIRKNIILFTIAFFTFAAAEIILSPRVIENQLAAGIDVILTGFIGRALRIGSLFLMAAVLFEQPLFYELNWREKLVQLIVFHKKIGLHLYHKKFQDIKFKEENQREIQESLIAGGMTGVSALLKEISQSSEELKIIDHGDQKIMLEHGEYITIALNVLEELRIFWDKLRNLRERIEIIYSEILKDFDGRLQVFKPIESMIEKEFS